MRQPVHHLACAASRRIEATRGEGRRECPSANRTAFALIELLVVIAIIAILAGMLLPVLGRAKARGQVTVCQNHLRQLSLSHLLYADDNRGLFPPRVDTRRWPTQLQPGYRDVRVLTCPSEVDKTRRLAAAGTKSLPADDARRSFIINGWNDYFQVVLNLPFSSIINRSLPESAILQPSDTIVFGEKLTGSTRTPK